MEYPDVQMHMATAKRGTWQKLGDTAKTLARLVYNSLTCDFSTATDGSWFLIAEGVYTEGYRMILVAPDNSIDFTALGNTDVVSALTAIRDYVNVTPISGWNSFVTWFGSKMRNYGGYVGSATVCGQTVQNMPLPSFPANATQYDLFEWLRNVADRANCGSIAMSGYRVGTLNKFALPVTVTASGITVSMEIQMAI